MKAPPLSYHRVESVDEAVAALGEHGDEAKVLAGGQSLVPMLNLRLASPTVLVDVGRIPGLDHLDVRGDVLHVGALTTHFAVESTSDRDVLAGFPVLPDAARYIGHYPIRTVGTVGGSIAHADPSAEWCVLSLALDATMVARGPSGERTIGAADFFMGFLTTALEPDELLVEVRFGGRGRRARLTEFARRHGDFGIVVAAIATELDRGRCRDVRISLGGVGAAPLRVPEAEGLLEGERLAPEAIAEVAVAAGRAIDPPSDLHASAHYRRRLAAALVREALTDIAATEEQDRS